MDSLVLIKILADRHTHRIHRYILVRYTIQVKIGMYYFPQKNNKKMAVYSAAFPVYQYTAFCVT